MHSTLEVAKSRTPALLLATIQRQSLLTGIAYIVMVTAAAQLLFSAYGFDVTDGGYILAMSRRLLDGQIPHRDFISIRPVGSPLLHMPVLLVASDSTFWISRLVVWGQYACISWLWAAISGKLIVPLHTFEKIGVALIAFILSTYHFPIMAWHTTDGLFLTTLGFFLCLHKSTPARWTGYLLLGMAYLCKQNFLLVAPVTLLLLGDWKQIHYWLASALPGLLYLGWMVLAGAMPDMVLQLTAQHDLLDAGIMAYIANLDLVWGIVLGYASMGLANGTLIPVAPRLAQRAAGIVVPAALCAYAGYSLTWHTTIYDLSDYAKHTAFLLCGAAVGAVSFIGRRGERARLQYGVLVLLTAWSVSISVGYKTPALAAGILAILLLAYGLALARPSRQLTHGLLTVVVLVTLPCYIIGRKQNIYLDLPADKLTASLNGVFPGAARIRTNENTYRFLLDLQNIKRKLQGQPYIIVPDLAANWVVAEQPNPLPIDWGLTDELPDPALVNRSITALDAQRGKAVFIVQKVYGFSLSLDDTTPIAGSYSVLVPYIKSHFTKVDETEYFEIYK